jgi:hypothetical protein
MEQSVCGATPVTEGPFAGCLPLRGPITDPGHALCSYRPPGNGTTSSEDWSM